MQVFLSWSGERSKAVARALAGWLGQVIQAVEPWLSEDIEKGAGWVEEIRSRLEKSRVGVVCLTRDNLQSPWLLFEAGALSKTKDAHVCTLLLDLGTGDVEPPLSVFQSTRNSKEEIQKLVSMINSEVAKAGERPLSDSNLKAIFETYWPRLETALKEAAALKEGTTRRPRREREMLEEILEILRKQERNAATNKVIRNFEDELMRSRLLAAAVEAFEKRETARQATSKSLVDIIMEAGRGNEPEQPPETKD